MTDRVVLGAVTFCMVAGCGAAPKKAPSAPAPAPTEHDDDEAEPAPPVATWIPKIWSATAALTPNKRGKLKPFVISFRQEEDSDTSLSVDAIDGLKAGTYHLVVHEGASCGPNATAAGPPWEAAGSSQLRVRVGKNKKGELASNHTKLMLDGDNAVTGHVLVLHEDKKGAPGKAIACGAIERTEEP